MTEPTLARRALQLLDLTSLGDDDNEATIEQLCDRAVTEFGKVAAVCVWPRFVPLCKKRLADTGVRVATVANFPRGHDDLDCALADTAAALAYGADEVDLVFPYQSWLSGETGKAREMVAACKKICGAAIPLKVILETGELETSRNIGDASLDVIEAGADFVKTSTGKTEVSATLAAATAMLAAIKKSGKPVGFKASGGIRNTTQAADYLFLADDIMGQGWAEPNTFRIGASGLLNDLLAVLKQDKIQ